MQGHDDKIMTALKLASASIHVQYCVLQCWSTCLHSYPHKALPLLEYKVQSARA